jgi:hypothetical protein
MFSCWNDYLESPKHVSWWFMCNGLCMMQIRLPKKKENHIKAKKWGAPYVVYEMGLDMGWIMSRGWTMSHACLEGKWSYLSYQFLQCRRQLGAKL